MPLSPEDQRRYDAIKATQQRIGITAPSPALENAPSATPTMDMSDAERMDRLRQLNARVSLSQAADR